jgi:DUF1680 family protein
MEFKKKYLRKLLKTVLAILIFSLNENILAVCHTDSIFYQFPNSGICFEGLYANPINGSSIVGDFNEDGYPDLLVMGPNYDDFTSSYVNLLINNKNKGFIRYNTGINGLNNGSIAYTRVASKQFLVAIQGGTASPASTNNATANVFLLVINNSGVASTKMQDLSNGIIDGNILFVDFNNDGYQDIVQFGGSRKVYTWQNNGNNSFSQIVNIGLKGTSKGQTRLYDINKDGLIDIISIDQSYGLVVYLNNGNNSFMEKDIISTYSFKLKPRFGLGDFNKDGNIDIVAFDTNAMSADNRVVFFYGDGDGNFTQDTDNNFMGVNAAAVAIADFNCDGNTDVLYAGSNQKDLLDDASSVYTKKAYILLGDGKKNFTLQYKSTPKNCSPDIFSLAPLSNGEYQVADFDNDGKPDVFALGELAELKGGKLMRCADLFLSSLTYDFGKPVSSTLIKRSWEGFPYLEVRLNDGSKFKQNQDKEIAYLKSLDVNRLLAQTQKYNLNISSYQNYGGWEESGNGASFAHYLSAVSMSYAATGDQELLSRANQIVNILIECQNVMGDGLISFNDAPTWGFYKMAKDKIITPDNFDENGHPWGNNGIGFPLYAHHKIFAGLRDAYLYTGNEEARIAFIKLCEWCVMWMQNFTDENLQKMIESEHGGMVEVLTDAYALSGKTKFLDAAKRFTRDNFAATMSTGTDDLMGRHSNAHVPMAVGAAEHYLYSGDARSQKTAHNFFEMVSEHHSTCNGGNGNNERFGTPDLITYQLGMRGPETCSSYNMLKLAKDLFCLEGTTKYLDFYENTLTNHIAATLSPNANAGVCYHTSLKPGTFRMYDNLYNNFWCCVGTGMESHVKYVDAIYFKSEQGLLINLFTPSTLDWTEKGLKLSMETTFPANNEITVKVLENSTFNQNIFIRYPSWEPKDSIKIFINGEQVIYNALPGELISLSNNWAAGDEIKINIPCQYRLVDLSDDINVSALFYGPVMLAANVGEVGQTDIGAISPAAAISNPIPELYFPPLKMTRNNLNAFIQKKAGTLEFKTKGLDINYTFKPFYETHHCRYNVYWKIGDDSDLDKERELIPDRVIPGDSSNEAEHNLQSSGSNTGMGVFNFWGPTYYNFRDAGVTGYISYDLNLLPTELPAGKQYYLQTTYFGSEPSGYGNFRIFVDNTSIYYEGNISYLAPLDFAQRYYPIPRSLTDGKRKITIKFAAGKVSLYGLKLTTTNDLVSAKKNWNPNTFINNVHLSEIEAWMENGSIHVLNQSGNSLKVFNISGQMVYFTKIQSDIEIFYPNLKQGIYLLEITGNNYIACKKTINTDKN